MHNQEQFLKALTGVLRSALFRCVLGLSFLLVSLSGLHAQVTVTNCSSTNLVSALADGGEVIFPSSCSITLTSPIIITNTGTTNVLRAAAGKLTLSSSTGQILRIASGVTFVGGNLAFSGGKGTLGGALYIESGADVTLTNCTFAGNSATGADGVDGTDGADSASGNGGNGSPGTAGGPAMGGAAYNLGTLTVINCSFTTNSVKGGSGGNGGNGGTGLYNGGNGGPGADGAMALGGAICSQGTLTVSNCAFTANSAKGGNGGTGGTGGTGNSFTGRDAPGGTGWFGSGGAIYSTSDLTVMNSTLSDNTSTGGDSARGGTLVNGNGTDGPDGADSHGGAICSTGQGSITNCTVANNKATGGKGGNGGNAEALFNAGSGGNGGNAAGGGYYNSGAAALVNCTIANCGAYGGTNGVGGGNGGGTNNVSGPNGSAGVGSGGGLANASGKTMKIANSIVTGSTSGGNGSGTILDYYYNISSDGTIPLLSKKSLKNRDPLLMALSDNGGPGKTMMPKPGSKAIDFVNTNYAYIQPLDFDERGAPRTGVYPDAGAVEGKTNSASGRVTLGTNGLPGVTITATNSSTLTDASGFYMISVPTNGSTLTPSASGYSFTPPSRFASSTISTGLNFAATPVASIGVSTSGVQVSFPGTTGTNDLLPFRVEASTNLTNWSVIATNVAPFSFTDPAQTNFPARFYRLVR